MDIAYWIESAWPGFQSGEGLDVGENLGNLLIRNNFDFSIYSWREEGF